MIERLLAADAAFDRGEIDVAARLFAQVADADPRNAIAVVGLARVAARRGAPDEARAQARRALAIDADEAAARRLLDELDAKTSVGAAAHETASAPAPTAQVTAAPATAPAAPRSIWRRFLDGILRRG